jgi:hypothetical protein
VSVSLGSQGNLKFVGEISAEKIRNPWVARDPCVEAVLAAVRRVRETPTLAAWFAEGDAARTAALAQSSAVIEALGTSVVDDPDDARWLVRVILSLLTVPGRDDRDERAMVERYVAPRVTSEA